MNVMGKMLHEALLVLLLLFSPGRAEEQRECFKCRARDRCFGLDTSSTERCSPDVDFCVKKETYSRVTGAMVTERYCGGRDFFDSAEQGLLKEEEEEEGERCYEEGQEGRRTWSTVCYCSGNYCNGGGRAQRTPAAASLLFPLIVAAAAVL